MFDIELKDNLIFTKDKIIAVFEIEPVDIFLMNKEDQVSFFARIFQFFNLLEGEAQFNVLVRRTNTQDFREHFRSLIQANSINKKRFELVKNVVSDMTEIIENPDENILFRSFYFHISQPATRKNERSVIEAIKKLDSKTQKLTGALIRSGISVTQVLNPELKNYFYQYYQ